MINKQRNLCTCWQRESSSIVFFGVILNVILYYRFCTGDNCHKHISVGIESSLRNLKKLNEVRLMMIADEFQPKWFGKQLIAMALSKNPNTKILIVPALKDITKSLLKVPSIVVTIKRSADLSSLDEFYNLLGIQSELRTSYYTIHPSLDLSIKSKKRRRVKETIKPEPAIVLLKKRSDSFRSFIPMAAEEAPSAAPVQQDSSDFISLSKFSISSSFIANSSAPLYRPPKIMKLPGNLNRKQKHLKIKKTC